MYISPFSKMYLSMLRSSREYHSRYLCKFRRLQQTGPGAFAALHPDQSPSLADAIRHLGAVVPGKRIERPVGIGEHADAAVLADQDAQGGTAFAVRGSRLGGVQNANSVLGEPAHAKLIGEQSGPNSA
jgi:hypothetical protein